jgi:hypothetical protein
MQNLKSKRGQGLVEYIMVVFLMAIATIAIVKKLGETTTRGFTKAEARLSQEW